MIFSIPLQKLYEHLIYSITKGEGHVRQELFIERYVNRLAVFQLINCYCWFLYLGLWTQEWMSLRTQLMTFFIVKPSGLLGASIDVLTPRFDKVDTTWKPLRETIQIEYDKSPPQLFDEYLQVAIVFGAATFFAPLFPEGLMIAFLHTLFEFCADKSSLVRHRIGIPKKSNLYEIRGWVGVFESIGWASIVVSTWLVYVFLAGIAREKMQEVCGPQGNLTHADFAYNSSSCSFNTWDEYVEWDPMKHSESDPFKYALSVLFSPGYRTVFALLLVEHILLFVKAYVQISIPAESPEVGAHLNLVSDIFVQHDLLQREKQKSKA